MLEKLYHISRSDPYVLCYYHTDGLGSITELSNAAGNIVEKYQYSAYGKTIIKDASDNTLTQSALGNRFGFTGRELDAETGLYFYRMRQYSSEFGRFLQTDLVGYLDDMNLYSYCRQNPINWRDAYGLFRFGRKSLPFLPWIPGASSGNKSADKINLELSHEHGFFEDAEGGNVGFSPQGRFSEPSSKGYHMEEAQYRDDLMRKALAKITENNYDLISSNCQDWADRLRNAYAKEVEAERRARQDNQKKSCNK
jgi:RHS repeat-associated protein